MASCSNQNNAPGTDQARIRMADLSENAKWLLWGLRLGINDRVLTSMSKALGSIPSTAIKIVLKWIKQLF